MKLPNGESAEIGSSKLLDYLLSTTHPVGKWKAKVFHKYGYHGANLRLLKDGLLAIAKFQDVQESIQMPHGMKYIIDGSLRALWETV